MSALGFFERHADRIDRTAPGGCWVWTASRTTAGYGNFRSGDRTEYAHRAAYEAAHGKGSAHGLVVRHRCDNPPCCNPAHLLIGTQRDNMQDMRERGRANPAIGERSNTARLSSFDVLKARDMARDGESIAVLARAYGVRHHTMHSAVTGATWSHLEGAVPHPVKAVSAPPRRSPDAPGALLDPDKVRSIRRALSCGTSGREVARQFGVSAPTVSAIKVGRLWAHVV